jgi:hypothetical protein
VAYRASRYSGWAWVLFGVASLRARVFPAAISGAILAGGLLSGIPIGIAYLSGGVILGLAITWLGAWIMRTTAPAPPLASKGVPEEGGVVSLLNLAATWLVAIAVILLAGEDNVAGAALRCVTHPSRNW